MPWLVVCLSRSCCLSACPHAHLPVRSDIYPLLLSLLCTAAALICTERGPWHEGARLPCLFVCTLPFHLHSMPALPPAAVFVMCCLQQCSVLEEVYSTRARAYHVCMSATHLLSKPSLPLMLSLLCAAAAMLCAGRTVWRAHAYHVYVCLSVCLSVCLLVHPLACHAFAVPGCTAAAMLSAERGAWHEGARLPCLYVCSLCPSTCTASLHSPLHAVPAACCLQQCSVLKEVYGMRARAYHGDGSQKDISSWNANL
jgi:hypothetical protein